MFKFYLLESSVLTGLGMFLYVRHHTRSASAALVAGGAFTFTPFRTETVHQPQYLGFGFLPIVLLAVDLYLDRPRRRWLVLLTTSLVLQALACVYLGFFTFALAPLYASVRLLGHPRGGLAPAARLAAAALLAGLLLVPAMLPYLRGLHQGVIPDYDLELIALASWPPALYFSGEFVWRAGVVAVALLAIDIVRRALGWLGVFRPVPTGGGWRSPEGGLWVLAAGAAVLAAGPRLELPGGLRVPLPYALLHDFVPGFASLRVPIRFVIVVALGLAAIAGFAFARATRTWSPGPRRLAAVGLVAVAAFAAAPRPAPVMAAGLRGEPAQLYRWLAERPEPGAVLEIPGQVTQQDVISNVRNGRYMVASTIHWRPVLNGYTAYPPPSVGFYAAAIRELPDEAALAILVDTTDLRWIVLHRGALTRREALRWDGPLPGVELVARFGQDEVYEVKLPRTRPWRSAVLERSAAPAADTLEGTSTAPLAEACRRGRILAIEAPAQLRPIPLALRVPVRIRNDSDCDWPGVGIRREGLVGLEYRWISPSGTATPLLLDPISQLLADVPPHTEVDTAVAVQPPAGEPGAWKLEVRLRQDGTAEPIASALADVVVRGTPR